MERTAETREPGSEASIPWSPWRVAAYVRWQELSEALGQADDRASNDYTVASERLKTAHELITGSYGARHAFRLYYSGAHIERTWSCLHMAARRMIGLLDAATLRELLPPLRDDVERFVVDEAERQRALEQIDATRKISGKPSDQVRDDVRALAAEVNKKSDLYSREVRAFRNLLVVISTLLLAALAAVAIVQAVDSSLISFCATPDAGGEALCPIGDQPGAMDVAVIELLGVVGGLLAAILPLAKAQRVPGPYGVAVAQTVLKGITGAGAAFVGVLLLQGELLIGFEPQNDSRLLAYAVFFGFAQHVLTRLVDQRVNEIAKKGQPDTPAPDDGTGG